MELFSELATQDMPANIKDICGQAAGRMYFIEELKIHAERIRSCNQAIANLKLIEHQIQSISFGVKDSADESQTLIMVSLSVDKWPNFEKYLDDTVEDILEYLTVERTEAAHQIGVLLSKK